MTERIYKAKRYLEKCEFPKIAPKQKMREKRHIKGVKIVKDKHHIAFSSDDEELEKRLIEAEKPLNLKSVKYVRKSIAIPRYYCIITHKPKLNLRNLSLENLHYFYIDFKDFIDYTNHNEPVELAEIWSKNPLRKLFADKRSDIVMRYDSQINEAKIFINPYIQAYFSRPKRRATKQVRFKVDKSITNLLNEIRSPKNYFTVEEYFNKLDLHKEYLKRMEDTFNYRYKALQDTVDKLTKLDNAGLLEYETIYPRFISPANFYMKINTPSYKGFILVHKKKSVPKDKKYNLYFMTTLGTGIYEDVLVVDKSEQVKILPISKKEINRLVETLN